MPQEHGLARPAFVCWIGHQGRSADLADLLGADLWLVPSKLPGLRLPVTAPIRYLDQSVRTAWRMLRGNASGYLVMQPPVVSLAVVKLFAGRRPVVADFHHDPFEERKWKWSLGPSLWLARHCAGSIVTNADHARQVRAAGGRVTVLHDPPRPAAPRADHQPAASFVLVPSSYSPDEPAEELIEAARSLPDVEFRVTGRPPDRLRSLAPSNVVFTGFVDDDAYRTLLAECSAVLCLTDKPNTMQRGGYEALSQHRPLVTADSEVLRDYFGDAAVYTAPRDPQAIASAVSTCLSSLGDLHDRMATLHAAKIDTYDEELVPVRIALGLVGTAATV